MGKVGTKELHIDFVWKHWKAKTWDTEKAMGRHNRYWPSVKWQRCNIGSRHRWLTYLLNYLGLFQFRNIFALVHQIWKKEIRQSECCFSETENTVLIWRYVSLSLAVHCTSNSEAKSATRARCPSIAWRLAKGNMISVLSSFVKYVWSVEELSLVT
jgi:hypothetical protein